MHGQDHQRGVEGPADPGDRAVVVEGGQTQDAIGDPQAQRHEGDDGHAVEQPFGRAMLGGAQAAGLRKRRAIVSHQSAPVWAAMNQTASVAATAKAKVAMVIALAALTASWRAAFWRIW